MSVFVMKLDGSNSRTWLQVGDTNPDKDERKAHGDVYFSCNFASCAGKLCLSVL